MTGVMRYTLKESQKGNGVPISCVTGRFCLYRQLEFSFSVIILEFMQATFLNVLEFLSNL